MDNRRDLVLNQVEIYQEIIDSFIGFVRDNEPILNCCNVSFLTENHWNNDSILSRDLRNDLEIFLDKFKSKFGKEEKNGFKLTNLVEYYADYSNRKLDECSVINRKLDQLAEFHLNWTNKVLSKIEDLDLDSYERLEENQSFMLKFNKMLKQNRFMSQKKAYEVDEMSLLVAKLCNKKKIRTLVDIGSGKAYLSTQLSSPVFNDHFKVIAIDSKSSNVDSALKRLTVMKRKTRIFEEEQQGNFQTFSQFIQSSTQLNELIRESVANQTNEFDDVALVGLHSCGNLSNSIINLYLNWKLNNSNKKLLCNVACCYNLLNEKYANDFESKIDLKKHNVSIDDTSKFPMSKYLNKNKFFLGFNKRMLACHSLDRSIQSLDDYNEVE